MLISGKASGPTADYVACKGEQCAKEVGKMRLEGKDCVVRDGAWCTSRSTFERVASPNVRGQASLAMQIGTRHMVWVLKKHLYLRPVAAPQSIFLPISWKGRRRTSLLGPFHFMRICMRS